jgi:hypothetical protein
MVVTIWCAIGMDREGGFTGKTASRNAPDHDGVFFCLPISDL